MEDRRMKYPIGVQDFEKLRRDGYTYIDKTAQIHEIVTHGNCYFLGRPRRFGKSLLLSTFEAYFLGKKELFKGLAIDQIETEWKEYPILHLDLNTGDYSSERGLDEMLNMALNSWESLYGKAADEITPGARFHGIIKRACEKTGRQVVILVDEYDKPLLGTLDNMELQDLFRNQLKAFYSVLKTQDRYIRFAFLTGVTKFGKVSIFSDLNNLKDISMDERYTTICGITEHEMHDTFDKEIELLAEKSGITFDEASQKLKETYDGYHFAPNTEGVYNPFSLLNALDGKRISDYWFETGTPTFLVQLLKDCDYDLRRLQEGEAPADELMRTSSITSNPTAILYQSGYLTIKDYDPEFRLYTLGFPNMEVERGFIKGLLPIYSKDLEACSPFNVKAFAMDIRGGHPEAFMERLQTFFEDADYHIVGKREIYFQNVVFVVFKMMGFYTKVERTTARGRADIVMETADYIYIIECKLDGSADDALRQIDTKGYATPYAMDRRKIFKIGVNFSGDLRGIAEWKIEQ